MEYKFVSLINPRQQESKLVDTSHIDIWRPSADALLKGQLSFALELLPMNHTHPSQGSVGLGANKNYSF